MTDDPSLPRVRFIRVDETHAGQRVDNCLLRELRGLPRSRLYRLLRTGEVRVNRGRVRANHRLAAGDEVRLPPMYRPEQSPRQLELSPGLARRLRAAILHEDSHLLAVNKPAGMAVHGGSGLSWGLIEAYRSLRPDLPDLELVHRLDRDTSGCLLLAKRRSGLRSLHQLLRDNEMDKRYQALVAGHWPAALQQVDQPLARDQLRSGERLARVSPEGRPSLTRFRVLQRFDSATLVEARPITGRTHQIRVHAQVAGHPILGDDKYGDRDASMAARDHGLRRLFLHAHSLRFPWREATLHLVAPLEPSLQAVLNSLQPCRPGCLSLTGMARSAIPPITSSTPCSGPLQPGACPP